MRVGEARCKHRCGGSRHANGMSPHIKAALPLAPLRSDRRDAEVSAVTRRFLFKVMSFRDISKETLVGSVTLGVVFVAGYIFGKIEVVKLQINKYTRCVCVRWFDLVVGRWIKHLH